MASIVKVNNIQDTSGNVIAAKCGTTVTLGGSGDTVALACGASATGFGLSWCATAKTAGFTAVAGNGYFINTCGGAFEVTLPATATAGDEINFTDFARTWGTACKELTLNQNSLKFQGNTTPKPEYDTAGATVKIVYSGATQGWLPQLDKGTELETPQSYNVQYLVVAGGGGGSGMKTGTGVTVTEGGGGAGGMRLVATKSFSVCKGASIPITVGAGGTAGVGACGPSNPTYGTGGFDSVFSTITSAGGGFGGSGSNPPQAGDPGGSGGGGGRGLAGGTGNTPASPCTQGNDGGTGDPGGSPSNGGGGGGHTSAGSAGPGGCAGAGTVDGIRGLPFAPVTYAAGGAGGTSSAGNPGTAGPCNSGNGGGAGKATGPGDSTGGAGGKGIVILRRVTACSCSSSGTVTTCGSDTIHTFTGDGTFVV
jgi:hypothetical protein